MLLGRQIVEKGILFLMYVIIPPPALCARSSRTAVKSSIIGVLALGVSFVSWIVIISALCLRMMSLSSSIFLVNPLMLSWMILRFGFALDVGDWFGLFPC